MNEHDRYRALQDDKTEKAWSKARANNYHFIQVSTRKYGVVKVGSLNMTDPPFLKLDFVKGLEKTDWTTAQKAVVDLNAGRTGHEDYSP